MRSIPTEPIGSMPRTARLLEAAAARAAGRMDARTFESRCDEAVKDTVSRLEAAGSMVVTDGEQRKSSFATYPLEGVEGLAPDGVVIPFKDGHTRQLPRLTRGPFRYGTYASSYIDKARLHTKAQLKQAVISASALSLLYPSQEIPGYPRERFIADLIEESVIDIRQCLDRGALVQIDFTEARLSLKLDPSGGLLRSFVELNNRVLERFTAQERGRIGVHTCPGGDRDSTHSADVDYAGLLPELFRLSAGRFYVQLASEADPRRVLELLRPHAAGDRLLFIGVTDPIDPRIETPEEVEARVLEAARFIPPSRLGTTDDCGFSPFGDDTSTSRETAFAKVRARVEGTRLAGQKL